MSGGQRNPTGLHPVALAALGGLAMVIPLYAVQLATQFAYFNHGGPVYFFLSSLRTPFFVAYVGIASFAFGRASRSLPLAWGSFAVCLVGLFTFLYALCDPRACYSTGVDGLEPLRSYSLFLAEGSAAMAAGAYSAYGLSRRRALAGQFAAYYAIAYYPVMFTVAGTGLVAPLSPYLVPALLVALSFVSSVRAFDAGNGRLSGAALPLAAYSALAGVSVGIAGQYLPGALASMAAMLVAVLVGSFIGAAGLIGARMGVLRRAKSKLATAVLILVVVFSVAVVTPDAVSATAPAGGTGTYRFLTPVVAGGFNAEPNFVTTGVAANFSFRGPAPGAILAENYLAAGMGVHSSNCCVDGIDYGFRADVFLYHNGSEVLAASAWEVCDTILACGGHTWKHLMYFSSSRLYTPLDSGFRLAVTWANGTALRSYSAVGNSLVFGTFRAASQENPDFDAGWLGIPGPPSPGGYLFFQFGVTSAYPIGRSGWSVTVGCPATLHGTRWECVRAAEFFQGDISFWKAMWRWGENYPDVGATVNPVNETMTLLYSRAGIRDFQKAW